MIRVPLAIVTQRQNEDGSAADGSIEASGGRARSLDEAPEGATERLARCGLQVERTEQSGAVQVTQGKTRLSGQTLQYDEEDGTAHIKGPVTFERPTDDGPLTGTADQIDINVDTQATTLVGNVTLRSGGGRVSQAARVEYDDQANTARLLGTASQPATSEKAGEEIRAAEILYLLDSGDVLVWRSDEVGISGKFEVEETP
ncbi:LptA/OstA family protein [Deinococcus lacus]|uniref:LptA/OstA family protein n=1 Tax=Deinococcus lacus TaxID=392561 RepID=A0ABW1YCI8_9DEIO